MQKLPPLKITGPVLSIIVLSCVTILLHGYYKIIKFQASMPPSIAILLLSSLVVFNGVNVSALRKSIQTFLAFGSILCYSINAVILGEQYGETVNQLLAILSGVSALNMISMLILGKDVKIKP
jgi:hypothetical protein